jgi:hypothetical protein
MSDDFGIFEPMFDTACGYLALLRLEGGEASEAVARVKNCCEGAQDPFPDIGRLLTDPNWRPHLVAAVAVILCGHQVETAQALWRRLDRGSWVTPQVGVALSLTDPDFLRHARERLEARCPLDASDLRQMTPLQRHSAAGPAGVVERSAKTAKTLLCLVQKQSAGAGWLNDLLAAPDFRSLLRQDVDASEEITEHWLQRVKALTAQ